MAVNRENHKKREVRISLRLYFSLVTIVTLCFACAVSFFIVFGLTKLFFNGEWTTEVVIVIGIMICILSMGIGGTMLWQGAVNLVRPIEVLNKSVKRVTDQDYTVQIIRSGRFRGGYRYSNEFDELSENFNKMVMELNRNEKIQKEFVSNVTHEIKTPITSITGITEILLEDELSFEMQKEYLLLVNKEAIRLAGLCENMLYIASLDNPSIHLKKTRFRLDEQIRKAAILITEKWSAKNIDLEMDCGAMEIETAEDILMQVWVNLLDNAVKYSPEPAQIRIRVYSTMHQIIIEIEDQGYGISKEAKVHIFERFYQSDTSHAAVGNGLGLSIVMKITEILNGQINCESELGRGTVMTVILPKK
ncbi:MAG: ATP-binding protein [Lachnospiraceae bacterium]